MHQKIRLGVVVALSVVLPAAITWGAPDDGKGSRGGSSNRSRSSNPAKPSRIQGGGSSNSFKINHKAPQAGNNQYQKKSGPPSRNFNPGQLQPSQRFQSNQPGQSNSVQQFPKKGGQYQQQDGTPSKSFNRPGQLQPSQRFQSNQPGQSNSVQQFPKKGGQYQQQDGTPRRNFGNSGDLKRDNEALRRYRDAYRQQKDTPGNLGASGDALRRYYRGSELRDRQGGQNRDAAFMKRNFPSQYQSFFKDSQGRYQRDGATPRHRLDRDNLERLNRTNSFVKRYDIDNHRFNNHWTHYNNLWNRSNRNWYWNRYSHWNNNWGYRHFSWYPWFGWGGWDRWGYGFVWPAWTVGYYTTPYYGYNYYFAANQAAPVYTTNYQAAAPAPPPENANPTLSAAGDEDEVTEEDAASAAAFADQGEIDFKAGNYHAAAKDWQHSLVDDPRNGAVMMLLAQALFAEGKYEEAAGATQAAMQMLPEDKWGVVISNYAELYGNVRDYTDQLRALEKARDANPESPALRFLLGFQFGYLNYPKQAVRELDQALTLAPRDLGSRKVRELFAARWPEAPPLPAAVLEAESSQPAASPAAQPAAPAQPPAPSDAKPGDKIGTPS